MTKEIILAVHGMGAQKDWVEPLRPLFQESNIEFVSYDLKAFGLNTQTKQGHIDSFAEWVEELENKYSEIQKNFPGYRITILGHSLGAVLTSCIETLRPEDRRIISVAGYKGASNTFGLGFTLKVLGLFVIDKFLSNKHYVELPVSEKLQDFPLLNDPLRTKRVTPNLLIEVLLMSNFASKQIQKNKNPVLFIQVHNDVVVSNAAQDAIYNKLPNPKEKKIYSKIDHDWIWSEQRELITGEIIDWIKSN